MKRIIEFVTLLILLIFAKGVLYAGPSQAPLVTKVSAIRVNEDVEIDGKLSEKFWKDEHAVSQFFQLQPVEGALSTEKTLVDVIYDDEAVYIGARMLDTEPSKIEARLTRKDVEISSDQFMVYIDPYHDGRTGYYFGVNAAGTHYDGTLYNDSWTDATWDGVWEARTSIDDKGWIAEFRIPYSQLRFRESKQYVWGINFQRFISRKNEKAYLVYTPRNDSRFVSRFPELTGIAEITPPRSIAILPYVTTRAENLAASAGDPFHQGVGFDPGVGGDMMIGLGTSLTLNATVNPDFGQVEVDPAVINLSDVETFYPEKRPFFVEGSSIFTFGEGGSSDFWGFNWFGPDIFYSRRIGRAPQGTLDDAEYEDVPDGTRIFSAAKLTGKVLNGWNLGTLHSFTAREFAELSNGGDPWEQEVEPAAYYTVSRMQREYNDGRQGIGFINTFTNRMFDAASLRDELTNTAFVLGFDGWTFLDRDKKYVLTGYTAFSRVTGDVAAITELQENSRHYFQRPDADYVELDPNATSVSGGIMRVAINKEKGNWFFNSAFGMISPGLDVNDLGFMFRADQINTHVGVGYRWTQPNKFYRYAELIGAAFRSFDWGGSTTWAGFWEKTFLEFSNYYTFNMSLASNPEETYNNTRTRGGPRTLNLPGFETFFEVKTDSRKKWIFGGNFSSYEAETEHFRSGGFSVEWKPSSNVSVSVAPAYETSLIPAQWIDNFDDPVQTETYGKRYVFGELDQKTFSAGIRLNWTFTPTMSFQFYAQPLISSGKYSDFKELAVPGSYSFNHYSENGIVNLVGNTYIIDPDGPGPGSPIEFDNPDFNLKSLRGNAIFRWGYRPGSTLFLVWTQTREQEDDFGDFRFQQSISRLWNIESDNIFMMKWTYYWNF